MRVHPFSFLEIRTMAVTVSNAFVEQFEDAVRHLAQQGEARLRPHVSEVNYTGEAYNIDRLAESDAIEKTTRRTATPTVEPEWTRRVLTPKTFHWADTLEHADKVQMLIDPQSAYVRNAGMAMRRAIDDRIIAAGTADATDGDGVAVPLPASQIIGVAGNSALGADLDLITQINEKFQLSDVDPDIGKVIVISPTRVRELLNNDKLTSADYMAVQALNSNGYFPSLLGFSWVVSNRLTKTAGTNASEALLAFSKAGIVLGVNMDMFTRIAERADLSHAIQVYMEWTMNATRAEDEHVVVAHLDQDYVAPA